MNSLRTLRFLMLRELASGNVEFPRPNLPNRSTFNNFRQILLRPRTVKGIPTCLTVEFVD